MFGIEFFAKRLLNVCISGLLLYGKNVVVRFCYENDDVKFNNLFCFHYSNKYVFHKPNSAYIFDNRNALNVM